MFDLLLRTTGRSWRRLLRWLRRRRTTATTRLILGSRLGEELIDVNAESDSNGKQAGNQRLGQTRLPSGNRALRCAGKVSQLDLAKTLGLSQFTNSQTDCASIHDKLLSVQNCHRHRYFASFKKKTISSIDKKRLRLIYSHHQIEATRDATMSLATIAPEQEIPFKWVRFAATKDGQVWSGVIDTTSQHFDDEYRVRWHLRCDGEAVYMVRFVGLFDDRYETEVAIMGDSTVAAMNGDSSFHTRLAVSVINDHERRKQNDQARGRVIRTDPFLTVIWSEQR